jgi:biopolymer transport protein TolR
MAGKATESDDMITEINVVPLVDIVLVVLIIFMLTANLIAAQSIKVDLPEASTGEAAEPTTVALLLSKDGSLYMNGAPTDEAALRAYIPGVIKSDPKAQAIIAADKEVSHGAVIHVIDVVRSSGIYKFALNIDPIPEPQAVETTP